MSSIILYWSSLLFGLWLLFGIFGTLFLYIGYGFAMAGKRASDDKSSQRVVVIVDTIITLFFVILDALLNLFFYSIIFLDIRPKALFTLVTGRLCFYNTNKTEKAWRIWIVNVFAAFLNGKDPSGHHVTGIIYKFKWLD